MASRYQRYEAHSCVICGRWFPAARSHAMTCGTGCRKRASRSTWRREAAKPIPLGWGRKVPENWRETVARQLAEWAQQAGRE